MSMLSRQLFPGTNNYYDNVSMDNLCHVFLVSIIDNMVYEHYKH
jgi:hypothetical protein